MPLKELKSYISDDKFIYNSRLFEVGKQIAQKRLHNAQMELEKIEYTQRYLQDNQQYRDMEGIYQRDIPDRMLITMEYHGALTELHKIELISAQLYSYAQEKEFSPVFPAGLLIYQSRGERRTKVYFEIMNKDAGEPLALTVPAGTFLFHKIDMAPDIDLPTMIAQTYAALQETEIIVANILLDKFQIGTRKSELQKRVL